MQYKKNWYPYHKDKYYNKIVVTWNPPVYKPPKFEPYFIFTKKNVFIAREPEPAPMTDKENPYVKPFNSYKEKELFKSRIIPYTYYCKSNKVKRLSGGVLYHEIKKPNYYKDWFWFNNKYIEKSNNRPIRTKKIKKLKRFLDLDLKGLKFSNIEFINKKRINDPFIVEYDKDLRWLRLNRGIKYMETENYKMWKSDRLLFTKNLLFRRINSYITLNEALSIINTKNIKFRPNNFPIKLENRDRFFWDVYKEDFIKEQTILVILLQNKRYFNIILSIIKNYPKEIGYESLDHWYTQELIIMIFNSFPECYWSHLKHWVKNVELSKKDQISNERNWVRSRYRETYIEEWPKNSKKTKKLQYVFNTEYPYRLKEIKRPYSKPVKAIKFGYVYPWWWRSKQLRR